MKRGKFLQLTCQKFLRDLGHGAQSEKRMLRVDSVDSSTDQVEACKAQRDLQSVPVSLAESVADKNGDTFE